LGGEESTSPKRNRKKRAKKSKKGNSPRLGRGEIALLEKSLSLGVKKYPEKTAKNKELDIFPSHAKEIFLRTQNQTRSIRS